jgi:hypothetical protein
VKSWASVISRIRSYPDTNDDSPVNMYRPPQQTTKTIYFSQKSVNIFLRFTVNEKPHLHFGYDHKQIGTHSICSGAAMALYLADTHPHKIMLLGRWSSDAFLLYLRPEVLSSFSTLSSNMIQNDDYRETAHGSTRQNDSIHPEDTLRRIDQCSILFTSMASYGGAEKVAPITIPQFHLFH